MAVLVALLVVVAACSADPGRAGSEPFTSDVGCEPRMDAALHTWAVRGVATSIVDLGGERECIAAYGLADRETGRANTPDTVYSIGSITKSVTAAAVFNLIDEGVLNLNDPAGAHVDGLGPEVAALTIRDLLLHTSGITGQHGNDHAPLSRTEAVEAISALVISFDAGTEYGYSNAGYTLLALIIDSVTEQGYRQYLVEEILLNRRGQPLGGFWDGDPPPIGPRAFGYDTDEDTQPGHTGDFDGPHWAMNGNGGIAMTPLEMAEWTTALFTGQLLSSEATELLLSTSTLLPGERELPGWARLDRSLFGEPAIVTSGGGGSIGHVMNVAWLPESLRVIVVAENAFDWDAPFGDILEALIVGTGIPSPPPIPEADPDVLDSMVGSFALDETIAARMEIVAKDGGLLVTAVGGAAVEALFPVPNAWSDFIEQHERMTLDLIAGETPEGARLRAMFEAESGPILDVSVVGTTFDGELGTYLVLDFGDTQRVFVAGLNLNGGTEFVGADSWPQTWMVAEPDNSFAIYSSDAGRPRVLLRPHADGIAIDGPAGSQTATTIE